MNCMRNGARFSVSAGRLAALLTAAVMPLLTTPAATAAEPNGGAITVTGTVEDTTCELDKAEIPVTLDTVSAISIKNASKADVAAKDFTVSLKNCGAHAGTVVVTVSGEGDGTDTKAFKNEATDNPANGVAMDFYSLSGTTPTQMKPGDKARQAFTRQSDGTASLSFRAAYVGTSDTITAGSFKGVVNFTLSYQ